MDNSRSSTVTGVLRLVFAFAGILAAVIANNSLAQAPTQFAIRILSSPSYAVTGGDALVEVRIPASTPLSDVSIKLNFQDVTSLFRAAALDRPDPRQNTCFQLSHHRTRVLGPAPDTVCV